MNADSGSGVSGGSPKSTLVIGGGVSGLAVASRLQRFGQDWHLIEAAPRLGGGIATTSRDGFLIDHGADMFAVTPPAAIQWCRDLGIDSNLIHPRTDRRGAMVWSRGRMHPIPRGFVLMRATAMGPMWRTGLLSPMAKLRFALERFVRPLSGGGDEPAEESVGQFVRRRMGRGALDGLIAPLVGGIYTADIERLSMSAAMRPILAMERQYGSLSAAARGRRRQGLDGVESGSAGARYGNFRSFPDGMFGLIRRVVATLPPERLQVDAPVVGLRRSNDRWTVEIRGGRQIEADRIVLTTPAAATAKLIGGLDADLAAELRGIESASAAVVCVGVHRDQIRRPIDAFGFVVPPRERSRLIAGSFASYKFDGRAPGDHVLVRCFVGGTLDPDVLILDDAGLVRLVISELGTMIGLVGRPVMDHVVRWDAAMPQYNVGHEGRIERIRNGFDRHPNLHWTNNAAGGVGIAPAIASANRLVDGWG